MERDKPTPENAAIPEPLEVNFDQIPERLRFYPHFVVWNYAIVERRLKNRPLTQKQADAQVSESPTRGEVLRKHKQPTKPDNTQE